MISAVIPTAPKPFMKYKILSTLTVALLVTVASIPRSEAQVRRDLFTPA